MVAAFATGDLALLRGAIEDRIAEPVRASLLPGFASAKTAALRAGALGASIAGGGPSAFAMTDGDATAELVLAAMLDAYENERCAGNRTRGTRRRSRCPNHDDDGTERPAVPA